MDVILSQAKILEIFIPLLKEEGQLYKKYKRVYARPAVLGEGIQTITKDGLETENVATVKGSFVVKAKTEVEETYIVLPTVFHQKYTFVKELENGYSEYETKGKILTIKLTRKLWADLNFPPKICYFEAPWGQKMILKLYDYMVSPLDYSEVYRIARKEFWETYKKIK